MLLLTGPSPPTLPETKATSRARHESRRHLGMQGAKHKHKSEKDLWKGTQTHQVDRDGACK